MAQKHFGTISAVKNNYVFVRSELDGESYFLHQRNVAPVDWPYIEVGTAIEFTAGRNTRGLEATQAKVMG